MSLPVNWLGLGMKAVLLSCASDDALAETSRETSAFAFSALAFNDATAADAAAIDDVLLRMLLLFLLVLLFLQLSIVFLHFSNYLLHSLFLVQLLLIILYSFL